jgi:membrane-bound serine protease (ClpP class)
MKKPNSLMLAFLLLGVLVHPLPAGIAADADAPLVYVIPIEDEIEPALVYVVRRGVSEAEASAADAIVFRLNTPGGRLEEAREIVRLISHLTVPTYAFVEDQAISAGAIISLATDGIYMMPGSMIGDAMPIMLSPFSGPQEMPENINEKIVSYTAALARSAAEQGGHDPELAEAMVRRENEYRIGEEVICPGGELLTLTNVQAERRYGEEQRPLLSLGTVTDLPDMLERVGLGGAEVRELQITGAERVGRMIQALSVVFLGAGLLGLYIEIKTPGFGLPGLVGLICLTIWFYGHHVAGLAGMEELALIVLGVILLLVEVFVLPGFGIAGFSGILLVVLGVVMAMVERYPGGPVTPSWDQLAQPLRTLALSVVSASAVGAVIGRFLPKSHLFKPLRLDATTARADGYTASAASDELAGQVGQAATPLRPAGAAMFGSRRVDVVTEGEYVEAGTRIRVVETHGNRILL